MALELGSRVGPYEITAEIGAGGMGDVYRAHDSRLGRDVAIKVSAERFTERFEREARAVAALNHPNICTLHDVGPDYLVMELVEGETLAELLAQRPRSSPGLPLDETLRIARQIASALEAAHEKGIVHRDLKPGNIKIKADGTVKVLDFGLAKIDGVVDEPARKRRRTADAVADRRRHAGGPDSRHGGLHGSRAGARQTRGQARRHLGLRRRPLRDADRPPSRSRARTSRRSWPR